MTHKEKQKDAVVRAAIGGQLTSTRAGKMLDISSRQVRKLKAKVRAGESLRHGNSKRSPKRLADDMRERIVQIYKTFEFRDSNFSQFRELLETHHDIKVSYTFLKNVLNEAGIKSPKKQRKRKIHKSRPPKEHFGEMLQTDGSHHQWFKPFGDNAFYTAHAFMDDATGTVTGAQFSKNECLDGYCEAFRQTLEDYGVPGSVYADGLSIFFGKEHQPSIAEMLDGIYERKTQFGAILDALGVELIHARSSQAKGKIERLWQTFQSRLVIEFKINKIDNVEKANNFMPKFLADFNKKFTKPATNDRSDFLPLPKHINLDTLLVKKFSRKLDAGLVFSLHNNKYRVDGVPPKATVEVLMSSRLGFKALYQDKLHDPVPLVNPERTEDMLHFYLFKNERVQYGNLDVRKKEIVQIAL